MSTVPASEEPASAALVPVETTPALRAVPTANPFDAYLASLAPNTRRTMAASLDRIAALVTGQSCPTCGGDLAPRSPGAAATSCPDHGRAGQVLRWWELSPAHSAAIRAALVAPPSAENGFQQDPPGTANKRLSGYRGVLKACRRLELLDRQREIELGDIDPVKGSSPPTGRHLDTTELAKLFRSCLSDSSPAGSRDAAVLAVLAGAGLRRSECSGLDVADYDGRWLTVRRGKGNKSRRVRLAQGAPELIDRWLDVRGREPGPLFTQIDRIGRMSAARLGSSAVRDRLAVRGREAGLEPFASHDLRRSWIGQLLDAGADLPSVQALAGHASPTTTSGYDRRPERAKEEAALKLVLPVVVPPVTEP